MLFFINNEKKKKILMSITVVTIVMVMYVVNTSIKEKFPTIRVFRKYECVVTVSGDGESSF